MLIQVDGVSKQYNEMTILDDISFTVTEGECLGIIGPNGSGKSTLLKLLSGIERADKGSIILDDKRIELHPRRELARWLAVLQQEALPPIGFTVREVVEMGRFPFQKWFGGENGNVHALINSIIEKLGLEQLQDRPLDQLSGGERQRAALGKTMAQQPKLLMLDEPTTYLDIGHQVQLMDQIQQWRQETGMTVIAVLHDLNLASMYCDRMLMMNKGKVVQVGTPQQMLNSELIYEVYGITPIVIEHPVNGAPQIMLQGGSSLWED